MPTPLKVGTVSVWIFKKPTVPVPLNTNYIRISGVGGPGILLFSTNSSDNGYVQSNFLVLHYLCGAPHCTTKASGIIILVFQIRKFKIKLFI